MSDVILIRNTMRKCFFIFLFFLSACATKKDAYVPPATINLVNSTHLIRTLINQNKLDMILDECNPQELELLLDNFSPAEMAFEAEVLSTTVTLVIVYYFKHDARQEDFIEKLELLAQEYTDVKFVLIDGDKLFFLAQDAEIENFPTVILSKNRAVLEKITEDITLPLLRNKIEYYKNL
jgi:NAD(P)H-hydrate repair Nnr-like enzyme with NAD(P)H-hydrate dehydratase domain